MATQQGGEKTLLSSTRRHLLFSLSYTKQEGRGASVEICDLPSLPLRREGRQAVKKRQFLFRQRLRIEKVRGR